MRVNNVLKPAKLPDGVVPLNTTWVHTVKTDVNGNVTKYKRLALLLRVIYK